MRGGVRAESGVGSRFCLLLLAVTRAYVCRGEATVGKDGLRTAIIFMNTA